MSLGYNAFHFAPMETPDSWTYSHYMTENHNEIHDIYFEQHLSSDYKLLLL